MWRMGKGLGRIAGWLFLMAAVLSLAAIGRGAPATPTQVTGVRFGEHPDMTRVVVDLSDRADYLILYVPDPYRVVIDLPDVSWQAPPPAAGKSVGVVKGYRTGQFSAGTWRIVLDVAVPVTPKNVQMIEPREGHQYRLVVDLAPASREAFLAEVKRTAAAAAAAAPTPAPAPQPRPGKKIVVLDPGHGGVDPGAEGRTGVYEKFITLSMAEELKRQLEASGRYQVVMTRDRDIYVPLRQRIALARAANANLFISLHADTIDSPRIRGLSVYTLSETASDEEAAALAATENKADVIAGVDLTNESAEVTNILIDLAQRETMNLSANFAEFAVADLSNATKLLCKTHRFAGFAVLKAPDVPSVLVELGYLSNPDEERQLREPVYRNRLAGALVKSVDRYFGWKETLSKS